MAIRWLGLGEPGGNARLCCTSIETHRRNSDGARPRASVSPSVLISHFATTSLLTSLPPPPGPGRLQTRRGISVGLNPPARSDPGALVSSIAIFPLLFWQDTKTCEKIRSFPTVVVTAPFWTANRMGPSSAWSMSCTFHSTVERAARCFPSVTAGSSPRKGGLAAKRTHNTATKERPRTRRPRGAGAFILWASRAVRNEDASQIVEPVVLAENEFIGRRKDEACFPPPDSRSPAPGLRSTAAPGPTRTRLKPIPLRLLACIAACSCLAGPARAEEAPPGTPLPSLDELEAQGATIGKIRVDAQNIFDLSDPKEGNSFFQLANWLHITTRPSVIERMLLFKPGDRVSRQVIDETERLLRANHFLYDVQFKPVAYRDGVVDLDVVSRDTWSLDLTGRYSRSGGSNSTSFGFFEHNLLGTGVQFGVSQTSDVDRHGSQFEFGYAHAFDGWTLLNYQQSHYSDGDRKAATVKRPFYALDARWAAGASWDDWDRVDAIYNAGDEVAQYRHRSNAAEVFGGWSAGLVSGWTQRYSVGVTARDDAYLLEPDVVAPAVLPTDHDMRGVFLRYEVVEDRFVKHRNRDLIARPEFFEMGFNASLQVTRALESLGSSRSAWLYSASIGKGFALPWGHDLLASATAQRQIASTGNPLSQAGAALRYYAPQSPRAAFYLGLSGDRLGDGAEAPDQLLLGGDNGLRGYPLRYQSGDRRALFTIEQRIYTDWYPFRLVRVGGAAFYDVGRAWGGVNQNTVNGGWLSDVGIGLRLASTGPRSGTCCMPTSPCRSTRPRNRVRPVHRQDPLDVLIRRKKRAARGRPFSRAARTVAIRTRPARPPAAAPRGRPRR